MDILRKILNAIFSKMENTPYLPKSLVFLMDLSITFLSFTITYVICFHLIKGPILWNMYLLKAAACMGVSGFFFFVFRTYQGVIRYSSFYDALRIFLSLLCANAVLAGINILVVHYNGSFIVPNVGFFINFILAFDMIFFCKMSIRLIFDYVITKEIKRVKSIPVLMYGHDPAMIEFVRLVNRSKTILYRPIGFISSDLAGPSKRISNLPVYPIEDVFKKRKILTQFKAIVINPRGIERQQKQALSEDCTKYKKSLYAVPSLEDWADDKARFRNLRKVKIEDLLQRVPIELDLKAIGENLEGKTLMITGAAGSIGSEIVRQVCQFKIGLLLICDVSESPLHEISMEINDKYPHINYKPLIADVRNYPLMRNLFEQYRPQFIYHAAAYKHVPLMENHPCEAILTNVQGSKNMADLAVKYGAEVFVMISTDKAVNPSNVMGASKRIAEIYVQSLFNKIKKENKDTHTRFITTRFGNVLGSNGSVIPRFEHQIKQGGPVTVTDPEIIRYFMTIPEACRLVLDAGNFGKGGEVFVFDMGDSVKIKDMAEEMIRLSGFVPHEDIEIKITGLRPGEKLYEELLYDKETVKPTHNRKIMIGSVKEYDFDEVSTAIVELLEIAKEYNPEATVKQMKKIVPEFVSQNSKYSELDPEKESRS